MNELPLVSLVIPCRNEEKFISKCLENIILNDYSKEKLQVIVVDGMSDDGTRDIIKDFLDQNKFIILIDNPKRTTPAGLNIGIKKANGDYIIILGSHSKVDKNFIRNNILAITKNEADCVGGVVVTCPADDSVVSQSIAIALSHPFGVGNSYFRIGSTEPRYVDTVPFGCYKKEVFQRIGCFDEELVRNQDDEFNMRLVKRGGKILLRPEIVSNYFARNSLLKLWRMYFQYGYFKPLVLQKVGIVLTGRQLIPSVFIGVLISSGILSLLVASLSWMFFGPLLVYIFAEIVFSVPTAFRKGFKYLLVLPMAFVTLHLSYGLGYLKGVWDFLLLKKVKRKKIEDVPLTR